MHGDAKELWIAFLGTSKLKRARAGIGWRALHCTTLLFDLREAFRAMRRNLMSAFPVLYIMVLFPVSMKWIALPTALRIQIFVAAVWIALVIVGTKWNELQSGSTAPAPTAGRARYNFVVGLLLGVGMMSASIYLLLHG
jgi:hypothetical protein